MHLSPPVAFAAVRSKAVFLLLLIYCFMYLPLFVGVLCWSLFWYALLYVLSSFAIILTKKRELVTLFLLSFGCLVTVNVLKRFLLVPWVGLQFVIVVFPDQTPKAQTSSLRIGVSDQRLCYLLIRGYHI